MMIALLYSVQGSAVFCFKLFKLYVGLRILEFFVTRNLMETSSISVNKRNPYG